MKFPKINYRSGQLLLELLVAITVSAIILGLGGNLVYVSLQSNKISDEKSTALSLANETMEAVQSVAFERWQNLYTDVTHNSNYYPSRVSDTSRSYKWVTHTPDSSHRWKTTVSINAVSALSSKNVWIVGNDVAGAGASTVWQYIGDTESASSDTTWTQRSPVNDINFNAVETLSDTEVWAGGASGALWKWNGTTWTDWGGALKCNTGATIIRGISASSSTNIWIVGDSGKAWKVSDASTCTLIGGAGVPTLNLLGVSALDSTHIWMVGPSGKAYSYNGTSWSEHSADSGASWSGVTMNSVSVLSATNVWMSGTAGNVWNYNGTSWTSHKPGSSSIRWGTSSSITSITAYSSTWVVIAGASSEVWEYDGTTWSPHYSGSSVNACDTNSLCSATSFSVLGTSNRNSTELWVVGASGNVWQFQPTKWAFTSSTEAKALGTNTFTRSFIVQNVCRSTAGAITTVTGPSGTGVNTTCSGTDVEDPSTQKVTVTVSWTGGQTITMSNYVTRWKNVACLQTQWASTSSAVQFCPSTVYQSKDATISLATDTQISILLPTVNATGMLTSAIFDTSGITTRGSAYNSVMWQGNALSGSQKVQFQIGVNGSDNPAGAFTYYGLSGGACSSLSSAWFDPGARDTPVDLKDCASNLNNKRYFAYKIRLCGSNSNSSCAGAGLGATSPTVTDVIINTSP